MAINAAFTSVTLASGAGTGNWKHPEQVRAGAGTADDVELDAAPQFFMLVCTANNLINVGVVKVESSTVRQVRLVSTHNGDSSTYLVIGFTKMPEWLWRSPG